MLGYWPVSPFSGPTTLNLNAANTWGALSFVAPESLTLSTVRAQISAVAGSGTLSVTCALYSDVNGVPGSLIAGPVSLNITVAAYPADSYQEWSGFTTLLTAGARYWCVFKNTTATPGTNYPTLKYWPGGGVAWGVSTNSLWGWGKVHTVDGSTWNQAAASAVAGLRLTFSDSGVLRYLGTPIVSYSQWYGGSAAYAGRECGVKFTTPANLKLNLRGIAFPVGKTGTPPGNLCFRIYLGNSTTPLASTMSCPSANVAAVQSHALYFASDVVLSPSTVYRITVAATTGGDGSNTLQAYFMTCDNDANSRALYPMSMQGCYLNGTWDDSTYINQMTSFALLCDTDGLSAAPTFPAQGNVATGSGLYGYASEYTPAYPTTAATQALDASTLTATTLNTDGTDTTVALGASNGTAQSGAVYAAGGVAGAATQLATDQAAVRAVAAYLLAGHSILSQAGSLPASSVLVAAGGSLPANSVLVVAGGNYTPCPQANARKTGTPYYGVTGSLIDGLYVMPVGGN